MTKPRPASEAAVAAVGAKLIGRNANDLRLHTNIRKFLVPSASHPHHEYVVHLTESDKRNSCTCEAHKRRGVTSGDPPAGAGGVVGTACGLSFIQLRGAQDGVEDVSQRRESGR